VNPEKRLLTKTYLKLVISIAFSLMVLRFKIHQSIRKRLNNFFLSVPLAIKFIKILYSKKRAKKKIISDPDVSRTGSEMMYTVRIRQHVTAPTGSGSSTLPSKTKSYLLLFTPGH